MFTAVCFQPNMFLQLFIVYICIFCSMCTATDPVVEEVFPTGCSFGTPDGPTLILTKKYILHTTFMLNWYGAHAECIKNNSRLARIESEEDHRQINQLIDNSAVPEHRFFVAGVDLAEEGKWTWDLTGPEMGDFKAWHKTQPDGGDFENCIELGYWDNARRWNDMQCGVYRYFICEACV